ncbi:MAG: alpha/beta hydrolase [Phycicoccus sp.]
MGEELAGLQCATLDVPLDHDKPNGKTIGIAMSKRPAGDPDARRGSLFVNPGGPGAGGLSRPATAERRYDASVLESFDIVGFDPRGIGASAPVQCFDTDEQYEDVLGGVSSLPVTSTEVDTAVRAFGKYTRACGRNAGPVLSHMSTLDVVRDLDLMRAAVGDEQLNFVGLSYGTLIGATYANVFPDKVGRVVVDGNVDPEQRTNDRMANFKDRAGGFETALDGFLAECTSAGEACAFAEGDPRAKFDGIRDRLRDGPLDLGLPGGQITLAGFTSDVGQALYGVTELAPLAEGLQVIADGIAAEGGTSGDRSALSTADRTAVAKVFGPEKRAVDPGVDGAGVDGSAGAAASDAEYSYNGSDAYYGVDCADTQPPRNPRRYESFARDFEKVHPTFGRSNAYRDLACATWPVRNPDRYAGPWDTQTSNPVLVVGNAYDPATPYVFAQRMTRQLGNAELLTLDGFGHCSQASECTRKAIGAYLVDGTLPAPGTVCEQDFGPFDPEAQEPAALRDTAALRGARS